MSCFSICILKRLLMDGDYRADFMMMNMKIQCNVISEAYAWGAEIFVPRFNLHLSEECPTADEGRLLADLAIGIHQRGNGTMRKLIDVSKLHSLGWTHKVEIEDGVK